MSKRGQETTSSEGSPMAKPKINGSSEGETSQPGFTQSVELEGKSLRRTWDIESIRGTTMKDKGDHTSTTEACNGHPKHISRTFSSEATRKCSKFRFLETGRSGRNFRTRLGQGNLYWSSDSKDRVSKHEVHKPSIHDDGLPCSLQKKLGITAGYSTFCT